MIITAVDLHLLVLMLKFFSFIDLIFSLDKIQ